MTDAKLKPAWASGLDEYARLIESALLQKDPLSQRARRIKAADEEAYLLTTLVLAVEHPQRVPSPPPPAVVAQLAVARREAHRAAATETLNTVALAEALGYALHPLGNE